MLPSIFVPVARLHDLIALKILARDDRSRPQDIADLHLLITAALPSDLPLASEAARLIESRGFNRCHSLVEAISSLWQKLRP